MGHVIWDYFIKKDTRSKLVGYADAGYLSDPHKARSQSGYVFTYGGTAISWRSNEQTLTATSSNHCREKFLNNLHRRLVSVV